MAFKVVLALAIVALAAADQGYEYSEPSTSFFPGAPVRAASESSEEDDGYKYQAPVRVFKHRIVKPKKVVRVVESSEEDGYNYDQPATTFTHRAPVRVAAPKPKKTYVAPVRVAAPKPKKTYVAPVVKSESSEEGYNYDQPAKTFSHRAPVRAAAPKPKNTYVAPAKPTNTYEAPARSYKESKEELDYDPSAAEYKLGYEVADDETGTTYNREEEREGLQTRGSYSVELPDGRTQTVTYYVDGEKGFVAEVTYTGEAEYPPEPEGGYGPWKGATAAPVIAHVSRQYSAPAPPPESSEEVQAPRGTYSAPRVQAPRGLYSAPRA